MNTRYQALLAALLLCLCSTIVRATTYIWYGNYYLGNPYYQNFDNNWNNSYNWYPIGVPGPYDTAIITNSTSLVYLNNTTYVSNLVVGTDADCTNGSGGTTVYVQGQTLYLYGQLTVNNCDLFYFNSGTIVGMTTNATLSGQISMTGTAQISGTLNVGTNSTLTINSGADHNIPSSTLNNYGTVAWISGRIRGGGLPGTVINNYGLWDSQGDLTFNSDFGADGCVFYNYGTFRKSVGTNTTTFGPLPFYSSGNVDVETGTVLLSSGGTFTGGMQTGNGTLLLTAGSYNLDGMVTTTNFQFDGGNLYGTTIINGALTWIAGNFNGATSVLLTSNSLLNVTSGSDHDLSATTFTNLGYVAWAGPGRVRGGGIPGTAIYNYGTWDSQGDWTLNDDYGGDGTVFYNYGLFRKSAGTASTAFNSVYLYNTGTLELDAAALTLNDGAQFLGGAQTGPGSLILAAGGFTLDGMTTTTNAQLTGGLLYGNNIINGGLTWVGGNWNNANFVTITSNSYVYIISGNDHDLAYISTTNYGTVAWSGGRVRGGGVPGSYLYNYGLWDSQGDLTFNNDYGGDGTYLYNYGTFRKSVGTNTTTVTATYFLNNGLLDMQTGNVAMNANFPSTGNLNIASGTLSLAGSAALTGGMQTGAGTLQLAGGSMTVDGLTTTTNVQMTGGTLYGSNYFTDGLTWIAGNWDSANTVIIPTNTALYVISGADHDLPGCTLNNFGSVVWTGGRLRGGGNPATVYNNYGTWDSQSDLIFNSDFGLNGCVFNNWGTFMKSGGTNSTTFAFSALGAGFRSSGLVNVETGSVVFNSGGTFTGGAVIGNGLALLAVGAFSINNTTTTTNVQEVGGNLSGPNVINGGFTWSSGNWNSANPVTILSNSLVNVVSGADHDLASCTLTNFGTLAWVSGRLRGGSNPGTVVYNYGLLDAQSDYAFNNDYGLNGYVFDNLGTVRKSGGTTGTTFAQPFNNQGTVLNLTTAPINFNGGGVFSGGSIAGIGILGAGYFNINGTVTSTNVEETGGYLYGSNVLSGGLVWYGANWNSASSVTVSPNTELDIISGNDHDLANCTVINNGRVEWMGGRLRGGSNPGTVINNNGVWEVQCDYALNSDYALNGTVFNNAGKFRKFNTTGTTTWSSSGGLGSTFANAGGSIELDSGTLSLPGSFSVPASGLTIGLGGTNAGQWGQLAVASVAGLQGPLTVVLTNNFVPAKPEQFPIVSAVFVSGGFYSAKLPSGLAVNYTNTSAYLTVTGVLPVQLSYQMAGSNLLCSFPTSPGQNYTLQISTNLTSGNWSNYTNTTGDGTTQQFPLPITNTIPELFLRVVEP